MSFFRRIANLISRSAVDREIDDELRSHIELRIDDNVAAGMPPEEARRDALLRFGNSALLKEQVTAADAALVLDSFCRDIRYAARQLRKSPGFATTAIVTLALAIAANVVVFGVLNALILRRLNLPGSERLFSIVQRSYGDSNQSYPDFVDFHDRNSTFSDMVAYRFGDVGLSIGKSAHKSWLYEVSGNYFDALGIQPALGRFFHSSDEHGPNSAPYAVLSNNFWHGHFNGDPGIVGTIVDLNKHPFTIIGVAPGSFHGIELFLWPDLWIPMVNEQQIEGYNFLDQRGSHGLFIAGKLKPGVSAQQATDNLNAVAFQLSKQYSADDRLQARLVPPGFMGDELGNAIRAFLSGIMLLAFLVLLAACANLAAIFGARAADRSRELAIRLAIGSGRWHILRQLLMEAFAVSLLGGLAGTLLAQALLAVLSRWQPISDLPIRVTVSPDAGVYAVALLLSFVSGMLPGLLPARQVWRTDALHTIRSGAPSVAVFRRITLRDLLLGVQIALCALLLTASLVAVRGMRSSLHAPLGFEPHNVILVEADMEMGGHSAASSLTLQKRMLEETARLPGVSDVGMINSPPLGESGNSGGVFRETTTDLRPSNIALGAKYFSVSPGYRHAAGTRLLAGRDFTWHDNAGAPKVALVNESFVRKMFDNAPGIGRHFKMGDGSLYEIAGVVQDGKYDSLTENPKAAIFLPLAQSPARDTTLVVRSTLPPAEVAASLRSTLAHIDPNLPFTIHSWLDALALVLFPAWAATASLGVMGLLAAILAATGVFGMAAYSVSKRRKELGIRIAVGARPLQLVRAALSRPLFLLLSGSAAGLSLGVIASRLLAQIVYQATPRDPLVFALVTVAMLLLGVAATWIPARRALRISPARLLREE